MKKKGALELSMNTIIIVVIGIALLTLGLKFVYDQFAGMGAQQDAIEDLTDKALSDIFGRSSESINLPKEEMDFEQGDTGHVAIILQNKAATKTEMTYTIEVKDAPTGSEYSEDQVAKWMGRPLALDKGSGKGFQDALRVDVPDDASLGSYTVIFTVDCAATGCGNEDTAIFILNVVA